MKPAKIIAIVLALLLTVGVSLYCAYSFGLFGSEDDRAEDEAGVKDGDESFKDEDGDGKPDNESGENGKEPSKGDGGNKNPSGNNNGTGDSGNGAAGGDGESGDGNDPDKGPIGTASADIKGTWVVEIGFGELMVLGSDVSENNLGIDIEKLADDIGSDAAITMQFIFDDDVATFLIDGDDIENEAEIFCKDYMDYLKNGGLKALLEAQGRSYDELLLELEDSGVTIDEYYGLLEDSLEYQFKSLKSLARKSTTKYTFDGRKAQFQTGGVLEVEIHGNAMKIINIENLEDLSAMSALSKFLSSRELTRK